jgi:hypothetical protein
MNGPIARGSSAESVSASSVKEPPPPGHPATDRERRRSPVLFGGGRRLFDVLPSCVELEVLRVVDTPEATHIRYRVCR